MWDPSDNWNTPDIDIYIIHIMLKYPYIYIYIYLYIHICICETPQVNVTPEYRLHIRKIFIYIMIIYPYNNMCKLYVSPIDTWNSWYAGNTRDTHIYIWDILIYSYSNINIFYVQSFRTFWYTEYSSGIYIYISFYLFIFKGDPWNTENPWNNWNPW